MGLADGAAWERYAPEEPPMSPREQAAWGLYCRDTAGSLAAKDDWHQLASWTQAYYLDLARAQENTDAVAD